MKKIFLLIALFLATNIYAEPPLTEYILTHSVIGGGGTVSGGSYILNGSATQPFAGFSSGGSYILSSGFWSGYLYEAFSAPILTTTAASDITSNSASSGGNVTDNGGAAVTTRGICWNTSGTPTISDDSTRNGIGTGVFTSSMSDLTAATHYYIRAYAINSLGTGYGSVEDFYTFSAAPTTQASYILWGSASRSSISLQWTNGNGDGRVVLCKQLSAISSSPLTDGTDYDADNSYTGSGSDVDAGKIVYKGTGNSLTVSNLTRNRLYYFKVFEYNGNGQTIAYNQSNATGNPNSRMTSRKDPIFEEDELPGEIVGQPSNNLEIVRISPNPAQDYLSIEFANSKSKYINISIFTLDGKLVFKNNNFKTTGNITELDLKGLSSGEYNLIINCENELVYGSFLIQK